MVCTSLGSLLRPLFYFLCSILLIQRVVEKVVAGFITGNVNEQSMLTRSSPYLDLLSVDASVTVPLLILTGGAGSNSDEEQREEQVE